MRRALSMSCVMATAVLPSCLTHRHHEVVDHRAHDRVKAGGRFVEEQDIGLRGDGTGERHALLHAAGEFGRVEVTDGRGEADLGQEVSCVRRAFGAAQPALREETEDHVLPDRKAVKEGAVLEQHADTGAGGFLFVAWQGEDVGAVDLDRAFVGVQQAEDAFRRTDLPVPEPPMTTMEVPGMMSRSMPSRTSLAPKDLRTLRRRILGRVIEC